MRRYGLRSSPLCTCCYSPHAFKASRARERRSAGAEIDVQLAGELHPAEVRLIEHESMEKEPDAAT